MARALAAAEEATSSDDSVEAGELPFFGHPPLPPAFGVEASIAARGFTDMVEAGRAGQWLQQQAQQQQRTERRHETLVARRRLLEAARRDETARREEAREEAP